MRLRIVNLPESPNRAPYLIVLDRVPAEMSEHVHESTSALNTGLTERTAGLCHGIIMVEGELEIE